MAMSLGIGRTGLYGGLSGFSPAALSGLVCWLDPRVSSSLTSSGGYVSQIADLSGNGNHATQASGASQPQIVASGINGNPALYFDGADDYMHLPSGLYGLGSSAWTCFFVHKTASIARNERLYGSVSGGLTVHGLGSNTTFAIARQTASGSAQASMTKGLSPTIVAGVRSGSNITCYYNGSTATGSSALAANNTLTSLQISNDISTTGIFGYMGTFLLYNRALSARELNDVGNSLRSAWGFSWTNI